jgi:phosphoenolpyruvate---glycerone phosphotransferase subunit DhaL
MNKFDQSLILPIPSAAAEVGETIIYRWMVHFAAAIQDFEEELNNLDRIIGDGDHGTNMRRATNAVVEKLNEMALAEPFAQLRTISMTMTSTVGGASGPLYGAFFLQSSHFVPRKSELSLANLTLAVEGGCRGVVHLGKATVGDKTMVDTLDAAVRSLRYSSPNRESLSAALERCRKATRGAAQNTAPMIARKGRASYLGERSAGIQDPGATSAHLLFASLASAVGTRL